MHFEDGHAQEDILGPEVCAMSAGLAERDEDLPQFLREDRCRPSYFQPQRQVHLVPFIGTQTATAAEYVKLPRAITLCRIYIPANGRHR